MENYNNNDINYIINNFKLGDRVEFAYKDYHCLIDTGLPVSTKKYNQKNQNWKEYCIQIYHLCDEMEVYTYNTIKELLEKTTIENKPLIDIWSKVEIISTLESNRQSKNI